MEIIKIILLEGSPNYNRTHIFVWVYLINVTINNNVSIPSSMAHSLWWWLLPTVKTKPQKHINANILLILAYLWEVSHYF